MRFQYFQIWYSLQDMHTAWELFIKATGFNIRKMGAKVHRQFMLPLKKMQLLGLCKVKRKTIKQKSKEEKNKIRLKKDVSESINTVDKKNVSENLRSMHIFNQHQLQPSFNLSQSATFNHDIVDITRQILQVNIL